MSYYLVAAAACDSHESPITVESVRSQSLRAKLEETVQQSIDSLDRRAKQEVRIASKERARAEREGIRAVEQRQRNEELLKEILLSRDAPAVIATTKPEVDVLSAIDTFKRLKIEDERIKRMAHPMNGIAGMYNTLDRPLSAEAGIKEEDCVPTVQTLVFREGRGLLATDRRRAEHDIRRNNLVSDVNLVRDVEVLEAEAQAQLKLRRDLDRYDEIRAARPLQLAPYPLQTAPNASDRNPFKDVPSRHPIDIYHATIRGELASDLTLPKIM